MTNWVQLLHTRMIKELRFYWSTEYNRLTPSTKGNKQLSGWLPLKACFSSSVCCAQWNPAAKDANSFSSGGGEPNSFPRPWGSTPSVGYCVSSPMRMMLMVYAWGHFLFETQRQSCVSGAIEPEWMLRDLFIDIWLFSILLCTPWQPWLLLSSEPGWVAGIHFVSLCVLHCLPSAYWKLNHHVNFCVLLFWHGSLAPTLKWEMDVTYMFRTAWGLENN